MGKTDKKKLSLWTTTLKDIDKASLPSEKDIEKALKHIKNNDIDVDRPNPEVEKLKKIFEPKTE